MTSINPEINDGIRKCSETVESDLNPIRLQLIALSEKYRDGGEGRIAFEVLQAVRALDEAISLAKLYASETPLPTLEEMHAILEEKKPINVDMWDQECGSEGTVSNAVRRLTSQWGLPPMKD